MSLESEMARFGARLEALGDRLTNSLDEVEKRLTLQFHGHVDAELERLASLGQRIARVEEQTKDNDARIDSLFLSRAKLAGIVAASSTFGVVIGGAVLQAIWG